MMRWAAQRAIREILARRLRLGGGRAILNSAARRDGRVVPLSRRTRTMKDSVKHASQVAQETVGAGRDTTRQVLIGPDEAPNFALRRFIMQPGGGMPRHTNTVEHEQYVLRGAE